MEWWNGGVLGVECTDSPAPAEWKLVTVITNVPYSPYAYICGREPGGEPRWLYRAVCAP